MYSGAKYPLQENKQSDASWWKGKVGCKMSKKFEWMLLIHSAYRVPKRSPAVHVFLLGLDRPKSVIFGTMPSSSSMLAGLRSI